MRALFEAESWLVLWKPSSFCEYYPDVESGMSSTMSSWTWLGVGERPYDVAQKTLGWQRAPQFILSSSCGSEILEEALNLCEPGFYFKWCCWCRWESMRASVRELPTPQLLGDSPVICFYWIVYGFSQQTFTADLTESTAHSMTAAMELNCWIFMIIESLKDESELGDVALITRVLFKS